MLTSFVMCLYFQDESGRAAAFMVQNKIPKIASLTLPVSKKEINHEVKLKELLQQKRFISGYIRYATIATVAQKPFWKVGSKTEYSIAWHQKLFKKIIYRYGDSLGLSLKTYESLIAKDSNKELLDRFIESIPMNISKCVDKQR